MTGTPSGTACAGWAFVFNRNISVGHPCRVSSRANQNAVCVCGFCANEGSKMAVFGFIIRVVMALDGTVEIQ